MNFFKERELLRLKEQSNLNGYQIAKILGMVPGTVFRRIKKYKVRGITWEKLQKMTDLELENFIHPPKVLKKQKRSPDFPQVYRLMQKRHQTRRQLWEEYRHVDPTNAYSESQFNVKYADYLRSVKVSHRQFSYAGEKGSVDWAGTTIPWCDSATGKEHPAYVFVGVLHASKYPFVLACINRSMAEWIHAHNLMFPHFGGVPKMIVIDNLKTGVTKPGVIPELNRTYLELARHYGFAIITARPYKPRDKPNGENMVGIISRWIIAVLRRRKFFSVDEINEAIQDHLKLLCGRKLRNEDFNRNQAFLEIDKPALSSLPDGEFEYCEWVGPLKIAPDYHVNLLKHFYSVPYWFVGKKVEIKYSHRKVEIFCGSELIASHLRSYEINAATTNMAHRPANHKAISERTKDFYLDRAKSIGPNTTEVFESQFDGKPDYSGDAIYACRQLESLVRDFGEPRFESSCEYAIELNSRTVKTVRGILQRRRDEIPESDKALIQQTLPIHTNVRGAHYFDGERV